MREVYAVGKRCTKAVAISTPVPKCFERKRNWCGTGNFGNRFAAMGNAQAIRISPNLEHTLGVETYMLH